MHNMINYKSPWEAKETYHFHFVQFDVRLICCAFDVIADSDHTDLVQEQPASYI